MKRPFNIFPTVGYKNSQFQIYTDESDINVEIFYNGESVYNINISNENLSLIHDINDAGSYLAKSFYNGEVYEQEFIVKDSIRLGSSEFKKSFVFVNSEYSFFLMKDRLLIYNENKGILLTENHYSPTEIVQINKTNFLFRTKVGLGSYSIENLGIYNIDTFSLVGELINNYKVINISVHQNKIWVFEENSKSIKCFEILNESGNTFKRLKIIENVEDYEYNTVLNKILINRIDKIIFIDVDDLLAVTEIVKKESNAVDKLGNILEENEENVSITNLSNDTKLNLPLSDKLNLDETDFIHLGSNLKQKRFTGFEKYTEQIDKNKIIEQNENKTYFLYALPQSDVQEETLERDQIYLTKNGIFLVKRREFRKLRKICCQKNGDEWTFKPRVSGSIEYSLDFIDEKKYERLVEPSQSFRLVDYYDGCLVASINNEHCLLKGQQKKIFEKSDLNFISVDTTTYLFVKRHNLFSVYDIYDLEKPILADVDILNMDYINNHKMIWYSGNKKNKGRGRYLHGYNLISKKVVQIDENRAQHSAYKDATDYEFYQNYILSSSKILINATNGIVKDSYDGFINSYSANLGKIVTRRSKHIYLSIFDKATKKYKEREIELHTEKYHESYLSPNGEFLILRDETNEYLMYDLNENKPIRFFSGKFLSFSKEGSLIFEKDKTRDLRVMDPLTFEEITPPNYHHYRFKSPDGKLYSQLKKNVRYLNKLSGKEITLSDVGKYMFDFDMTLRLTFVPDNKAEYENEQKRVHGNRMRFYLENKYALNKMGIESADHITSNQIYKREQYIEIGIVGTDIVTEIILPDDLKYYNYASFSYDNKYFGYVGKPPSNGLIHLFKLNFNEREKTLSIEDSYLSRYPSYASWVCGFSKTGYFATYDSNPNTYILKMDDEIFKHKTSETELKENIYKSQSNLYQTHNAWSIIEGKNFLCFSPSGEYLGLSEQGYEPLTLGGYGHQESNVVHIAETTTGKIVESFTEHGDKIKDDNSKKVTFVAFSEDESKLMTLSADGVVLIRNLNIRNTSTEDEQVEIQNYI